MDLERMSPGTSPLVQSPIQSATASAALIPRRPGRTRTASPTPKGAQKRKAVDQPCLEQWPLNLSSYMPEFYITMSRVEELLISAQIFTKIAECYEIPLAFIQSLLQYQHHPLYYGSRLQPHGPGGGLVYGEYTAARHPVTETKANVDFWYLLRARVSTDCSDQTSGPDAHKTSAAGQNQMNPFHLLHLSDQKTDVRGFELAVFFQHSLSTKKTTVLCVNFYSRGGKPVEELQRRILHALEHGKSEAMERDPFWVHLVYISVVLQWWKATLAYFSLELISHWKEIERKMETRSENDPTEVGDVKTNRALHAMTAHCLRYETEIDTIAAIISELIQQHQEVSDLLQLDYHEMDRVGRAFKQQLAEVKSIARTQSELAKKTKNTLALVGILVSNGAATKEILNLGRSDAKNTYQLALQIGKDSFAMKTIAFMTVFFLPATAFSAILALPYFQERSKSSTLWLWASLTGIFTVVIFGLSSYIWNHPPGELYDNPNAPHEEKDLEKQGGLSDKGTMTGHGHRSLRDKLTSFRFSPFQGLRGDSASQERTVSANTPAVSVRFSSPLHTAEVTSNSRTTPMPDSSHPPPAMETQDNQAGDEEQLRNIGG
ncbi:hypothetical protein K440DRAFT_661712 [Wilcoxina mikolae CBS 423.85]|nr:hypothetical protein K440DRAFT_661712 [Wilcoxina mikolae CBS 423.85]